MITTWGCNLDDASGTWMVHQELVNVIWSDKKLTSFSENDEEYVTDLPFYILNNAFSGTEAPSLDFTG